MIAGSNSILTAKNRAKKVRNINSNHRDSISKTWGLRTFKNREMRFCSRIKSRFWMVLDGGFALVSVEATGQKLRTWAATEMDLLDGN